MTARQQEPDRRDELLAKRKGGALAPHEVGELRGLLDRDLDADVTEAMYLEGRLYLVRDGDCLLEPIDDGPLQETFRRPDAEQCFSRQVNFARDWGNHVEVRRG